MRLVLLALIGCLCACGPRMEIAISQNRVYVDGVYKRFKTEPEFAQWLVDSKPGSVDVVFIGKSNSAFAYRVGEIINQVGQAEGFHVEYRLRFDRQPFEIPEEHRLSLISPRLLVNKSSASAP